MRPLAKTAIEVGLVDDETLAQFRRWRLIPEDLGPIQNRSPDEVVESIQDALEDEGQTQLKTTDLDILRYYTDPENQVRGQLVLLDHQERRATKTIVFAIQKLVNSEQDESESYILPWISEEVTDLILNGHSYLRWKDDRSHRVYMLDMEDLYIGDVKMFTVGKGMEYDG